MLAYRESEVGKSGEFQLCWQVGDLRPVCRGSEVCISRGSEVKKLAE